MGTLGVLKGVVRESTSPNHEQGTIVGPGVANNLKATFPGKVAVQGVDYAALLSTNFLPGGADLAGIREMKSLLNAATNRCPNSIIVTGGYSYDKHPACWIVPTVANPFNRQGAAVNHRAIEDLPQAQKDRIAGVVTFGDTQARIDNGQIPNFPRDKVKIICASLPRDTVCDGILTAAVLPPHLSYGLNADEGADFLARKIRAGMRA